MGYACHINWQARIHGALSRSVCALLSAAYAIARCRSVCPSVGHTGV